MRNYRRRNAISAHSTSIEAQALRTFTRLAQSCHNRGGLRHPDSFDLQIADTDTKNTVDCAEKSRSDFSFPSIAPAA